MAFTVNDILALALAGFNASQIAALSKVDTTPAAPAPAAPAPAPAAPAPAPAAPAPAPAAPAPAPAAPAPADPLSQILAQLQLNAINASQQPKVQTADEILAEIINPTINKEGK